MRTQLVFLCLMVIGLLAGCENRGTGFPAGNCNSPGKPACPDYPIALVVDPDAYVLYTNTSRQYQVTALYQDGGKVDVTDKVVWDIGDTDVVTISSTGVATGISAGSSLIEAVLPPQVFGAEALMANATIVVNAGTQTQLKLTPKEATTLVGITRQLTATAIYELAYREVNPNAVWTSFDPSVASVDDEGNVTGVGVGSTTISVTYGGFTQETTITVEAVEADELTITPIGDTLPAGIKQQYQAILILEDGENFDVTDQCAWTVVDTSIATIDSDGLLTGVSSGTTGVRATVTYNNETIQMVTPVTVTNATLTGLAVTPADQELPFEVNDQYTATATFSDESTEDVTGQVYWTSSAKTIANVSNEGAISGRVRGFVRGDAEITATFGDTTASTSVMVRDTPPLLFRISPRNEETPAGTQVQYRAEFLYLEQESRDVTDQVIWYTSDPDTVSIDNQGLATAMTAGSVTVTTKHLERSSDTDLTVTNATLTSLSITPDSATITAGDTEQFTATATFSDDSTKDVTSTASWTSVNNNVVQVETAVEMAGMAKAIEPGETNITATFQGVDANASVTVTLSE